MMSYELDHDLFEFQRDTTKLSMAHQALENTLHMYDYVKQYGINRTFLSLYNSNGELNNLTGIRFPTCESMGPVGNPNSHVSQAFIAAMEDGQGGVVDAVVKFAKAVWAKIKAFFIKIWAKLKEFFKLSNKKEATLLQKISNGVSEAAQCTVKVFTNKSVLLTAFGVLAGWAGKGLKDYLTQKGKELTGKAFSAVGKAALGGIKNGFNAMLGRNKNANQQQQAQPQQQQQQAQPQQQQQQAQPQQQANLQVPATPKPEVKDVPVTGANIQKAANENHKISAGVDKVIVSIDVAINIANNIADTVAKAPFVPQPVAEAGKMVGSFLGPVSSWAQGIKKAVVNNVNQMDKAVSGGNQQQQNGWKEEGEPGTQTQQNQDKTPQEFTGNYQYKGPE